MKRIMRNVYPILITKVNSDYLVYAPDIDSYTSGKDIYEAMFMARDLFGTVSLDGRVMPEPSTYEQAIAIAREKADDEEITWSKASPSMIDIDFDEYKRKFDNRKVKKNCTIPAWLNEKAEAAGINFSRVLQEALVEKLG